LLAAYRDTWRATGPAGRWFLIGGALYAVRLLTFTVAFPLYAKARGFDAGEIGWLIGGLSLSLFLFGVPVTILGTRGHARALLIAGPIFGATGQLLLILSRDDGFLLAFLGTLLSGMVSTMFWILGDPLLAATTPPSRRAHVYALKFSLVTGGFALGGGLGGWIPATLERVAGVGAEPALAATMAAVALLDVAQVVAYALMSPVPTSAVTAAPATVAARSSATGSPTVWLVLFLLAAPEMGMAAGHQAIRPFLPLFFDERHGLSAGSIGTTMAGLALAGGVGVLFVPSIAARFGNLRTIAGLRLVACLAIALWFSGVGIMAVVAMMLVYYVVCDGTGATFITEAMERLPIDRRTAFTGLYAMLWSAASFAAATASGALQGHPSGGFGVAFGLGVIGYLGSAIWISLVFPRLPRLVHPDLEVTGAAGRPDRMRDDLIATRE
jgi:MFS family permease